MTYRTVVVGTDGSATAQHAVDQAARMAAADSARLVVVSAFERHDDDPHDEAPRDVRWMLNDANDADQIARQGRHRAQELGAGEVVVQALEGPPADKLIETATDFNADLIVVGSVGLASSARFLLGSVASSVLHHAPCDVLVVQTT